MSYIGKDLQPYTYTVPDVENDDDDVFLTVIQ
jgi:hypothetical protein